MKFRYLFSPLLLLLTLSSCGDDDNVREEPTPGEPVRVTATSPSDGSTVDASSLSEITITYNTSVELNRASKITLNDSPVKASVRDGNTIVINASLAPSQDYAVFISEKTVIVNHGLAYAPSFTLRFSTEAVVEPPVPPVPTVDPLTNASATRQARNLYDFLVGNNGKKILSGAMANVNNNNDFADWIQSVTGKYPALTGYDFIHLADSRQGGWIDYSDISAAADQWDNNGVVSYMWHWNAPSTEADYRGGNSSDYGFYAPGKGGSDTEFDIREALEEGTWQNEFILADIDKVAGFLKILRDRGIPVLWRPLHEAAGDYRYGAWFWWGRYGDQYTKELWKLMYDRLVNLHGLDNLIWVWTAQATPGYYQQMKDSYPGNEFVDIVGVDLYPSDDNSQIEAYDAAVEMTSGRKIVGLSEVGRVPDPAKCMADGASWSWFMIWYTYNISQGAQSDSFGNTRESLRSVMSSPYVINRDQMPSLK